MEEDGQNKGKRKNENKAEKKKRNQKDEEQEQSDEEMHDGFEDPYGDEFEEEVVVEEEDEDDDTEEGMQKRREREEKLMKEDMEEEEAKIVTKIWRPGVDRLEDGEVLDYSSKDYIMFHRFTSEWPCLSFDVVTDKLGYERKKFPQTMYLVTGTQADKPGGNKLITMKVSHISKTQNDSDDESDEDDNDEDEEDEDPILEHKEFYHNSTFNRVRTMPQKSKFVATWKENNQVAIWNIEQYIQALDIPPAKKLTTPLVQTLDFETEGFAIDWSKKTEGRLAVGDINKNIYVVECTASTWVCDPAPFLGHKKSVEDIQWSPTEDSVFGSCSADKTIKIWDTRAKNKPGASVVAHSSDVNVISWNSAVSYLLLSGSDDGSFRIWDLRNFKSDAPAAHFAWHKLPITSVSWDPNDDSALAVASADNTVTLWDLSLEKDPEEDAKLGVEDDFPPQLLFVHQGQKDIKEIRWHPQILGAIIATSQDGFNIFKPDI